MQVFFFSSQLSELGAFKEVLLWFDAQLGCWFELISKTGLDLDLGLAHSIKSTTW